MIRIEGDFEAKMNNWQELLNDAKVIVTHSTRAAAELAISLVAEGFADEEDPYGKKWAPKKVDDGRKVLHGETSRLRTGFHVSASDEGFTVTPSVEYAAYHQSGTSRMPARMMVPEGSRGLPKKWAEEFNAIAIATATNYFSGHGQLGSVAHARAAAGGGGGGIARSRSGAPKLGRSGGKRLRVIARIRGR